MKIIQLPCIYHSLGHLKPAHSVTLFNIHALCELGAVKQIKMNFYLIKPKYNPKFIQQYPGICTH